MDIKRLNQDIMEKNNELSRYQGLREDVRRNNEVSEREIADLKAQISELVGLNHEVFYWR